MNKELEKKSFGTEILRIPKNKELENAVTADQILKNSNPSKEEAILLFPPSPPIEPKPDFQTIYDKLHDKFPEIINIDKPVLLRSVLGKKCRKRPVCLALS
jgi:hypothetical protein